MAIDKKTLKVDTNNEVQAVPLNALIGDPLKACMDAQTVLAQTFKESSPETGKYTDSKSQERQEPAVHFDFMKDGRKVQVSAPLLSVVPIPPLNIGACGITFDMEIDKTSSVSKNGQDGFMTEGKADGHCIGGINIDTKITGRIHAVEPHERKRMEKKDSKYSTEYTMDVAVKAGGDCMPAGLEKVLDLLSKSLDVCDPNGTLEVNAREFKGKAGDKAILIATYKNRDGIFEPEKIQLPALQGVVKGDCKIFELPIYEGEVTSYLVNVPDAEKRVLVRTIGITTG